MAQTKGQSNEEVNDAGLKNLGTLGRDQLDVLFGKLNTQFDAPLRLSATYPTPDSKLNFLASSVAQADGASVSAPALKSQVFSLVASTIDFQTQVTTGATFSIAWPASTVGQFRRVGFTLLASGSIQVLFSAESATLGALVNAGTLLVKSGIAIGYIDLECTDVLGKFKTAGSATSIIENVKISRFSSGSGGGSASSGSSSGGGELSDLMYKAMLRDSFSDQIDGTTPVDVATGKTDPALYDSSNELIRLNYDASKTVTGTGTSMTLSGAPSFTVKNGDVMIVGSEVKKLTVLTQTTYTLESAFTVDPTAAACCVSQAVHTVDLNNFNNGGLGLSAASQFSASLSEALVAYNDTETLGDIIPNYGQAPVIAYSASTDATSWTTSRVRVTSLESSEGVVSFPTTNPNLYVRFFANKTSGTGAVNLLGFEVAFHSRVGQVAGAQYYTAFARPTSSIAQNCSIGLVSGKTRFTFTFPYTRGLNNGEASGSVLEVIANGQVVPRYVAGVTDAAQAYFVEINDNTIEMDTDYSSAGIDFQFKVQRVGIIDNNSLNTVKIALHEDLLDQSLDAQVIPSYITAVNGAPAASQFRSDITGRTSIPDLSSMLSVQMGPQRMMTQEIYQLQTEFGPAGQPVYGAVNDKFNQIRFVGSWIISNNTQGAKPDSSTVIGDYVEIVFYGTGLNILSLVDTNLRDARVSVDGGSEGTNILNTTTGSGVLAGRNYGACQIFSAVSGLSLGLHTVKIRNNLFNLPFYGFEVLTETTSLRVTPGTVMKGKYKNSLSALQTIAYDSNFESGTLGTRGGCVLVYLKNDGTIGKAVTPTDATALYLTNASHANEEAIRTHHFREFGCGRADDFSSLITTASNRAFTLDDGVTTLAGQNVLILASSVSAEGFHVNAANDFLTLTFIGTGLDAINVRTVSSAGQYTVYVDGVSQGVNQVFGIGNNKICSGLPYGTHTVKILATSVAGAGFALSQFIVYAPKKPALPVGSVEVAQYYKMADYVANTVAGATTLATGVLRKSCGREFTYEGTGWTVPLEILATSGLLANTNVSGAKIRYTFFGTGFDFRFKTHSNSSSNVTVNIDGSTNHSSLTTSVYGTGATFVAATGVLDQLDAATTFGSGLAISGLTLGLHTITFTNNTTNFLVFEALDIISPIHAPTINGPYVVQNTLSLGNNGFLDLRKFNKRDIVLSNQGNISQAFGVANAPTSTSTAPVPLADMSVTHLSKTGRIRISATSSIRNSSAGASTIIAIYINGVRLSPTKALDESVSLYYSIYSDYIVLNVPIGINKIDVYWSSNTGTVGAAGLSRNLTVEDI